MYHWNWHIFLEDTGGGYTYLQWLMSAWKWTIAVAVCGWIVALFLGILMGTLRTVPNKWLSFIGAAWVELFRNIPLLVQIFLWYFVVPEVFPALKGFPTWALASLALGYFTSARVAEQVRSGLQSLSRGQSMAGLAMGLTLFQTYRYVLLPMAMRIIMPPLTSEAMNIVKNSSVAFAVSIPELTLFAMQAQEETARGVEVYLAVSALYILTAYTVNLFLTALEKKLRVPGYVGH